MNNKPRIGRPANQAGHLYRTIGVSGTPAEIAAVLELTPRERMEAMLAAIRDETASDNEDDRRRWTEYTRYNPGLIFTASE